MTFMFSDFQPKGWSIMQWNSAKSSLNLEVFIYADTSQTCQSNAQTNSTRALNEKKIWEVFRKAFDKDFLSLTMKTFLNFFSEMYIKNVSQRFLWKFKSFSTFSFLPSNQKILFLCKTFTGKSENSPSSLERKFHVIIRLRCHRFFVYSWVFFIYASSSLFSSLFCSIHRTCIEVLLAIRLTKCSQTKNNLVFGDKFFDNI